MKWDEVYGSFKKFADRTAKKINQTADIAALQVKLSMAEKRLEDAFTILGHAAYEHLSNDEDQSEKVTLAVDSINHIKLEIRALEEQIEEAKQRAEKENAEATAPSTDEQPAQAEPTSTVGTEQAVDGASIPVSAFAEDRADAIEIRLDCEE